MKLGVNTARMKSNQTWRMCFPKANTVKGSPRHPLFRSAPVQQAAFVWGLLAHKGVGQSAPAMELDIQQFQAKSQCIQILPVHNYI